MPRLTALVGLILLSLLVWTPVQAAEGGIHWLDYPAAAAAQKKQAKPMLIYFHLPYCYRCKEMKIRVYSQAAVIDKLNRDFIAAKVDADKDKATTKLFNSQYTPTYVFLNAAGKEVYRDKGVIGVERFLGLLDYISTQAYKKQSLDKFMKGH
ncbi:thioredoxin family protein [Desulfoferula mesophila]|uniref:Thioredoxin domain-containing protein n=1 Tax=Desulfoferula mesophila TaxID=3058419 RepID=A0AAU9EQX3_9BACT|nr:hypothetical protein FAK_39150 [Desulfoferula mesophilus]